MALGCAHLLGYRLAQNFNMPYLAVNVSEFWRRWHMSLSSWIRDYLFIPMGGSRGTHWQTNRNLLVTMTLAGLWHGAGWPFVMSRRHARRVMLMVHAWFRRYCDGRPGLAGLLQTAGGIGLRVALTFAGWCCSMVIFRAPPLAEGRDFLRGLMMPRADQIAVLDMTTVWYAAVLLAICHALAYGDLWKRLTVRIPAPVAGFGHALTLTATLLLVTGAGRAFVYFQF